MKPLQVFNLFDPFAYASAAEGNPDKPENTFFDNMWEGYYKPEYALASMVLPTFSKIGNLGKLGNLRKLAKTKLYDVKKALDV